MKTQAYLVPFAFLVSVACGADDPQTRSSRTSFDNDAKFRFLEVLASDQGADVTTSDARPTPGTEHFTEVTSDPSPSGGEQLEEEEGKVEELPPTDTEPTPPSEGTPDEYINEDQKDRAACAAILVNKPNK